MVTSISLLSSMLSQDGLNYSPRRRHHIGRFESPEVIHTDQGPAFHNELVTELLRLGDIQQSFGSATQTFSVTYFPSALIGVKTRNIPSPSWLSVMRVINSRIETIKRSGRTSKNWISMEGANLSGLSEEPSELVTLLCKVVGKEKKNTQKEKETGMNITEKMALAQQGCSGDIKQELTGEKDDEKGALTSNN